MTISISYELKPSSQSSHCDLCGKGIHKGEERIAIRGDAYRNSMLVSYHPKCFEKQVKTLLSLGLGNSIKL